MSYQATVYRILIASPGDLGEERNLIPEVISQWNAVRSESSKVVVLPVKWETHSAPILGSRPQQVINEQLVGSCDLLVGLFWTRIGTHTGISESGTTEEIEYFINQNKPVMLYFSSSTIDPEKIDIEQYSRLKAFKAKMRPMGLVEGYTNSQDFKEKFAHQLDLHLDKIINGISITPKQATSTEKEKIEEIRKDKVYIEDYEKDGQVRSFLVKGDTTPIKEKLKELGGRWNGSLGGWIFSKNQEDTIANFLKNR